MTMADDFARRAREIRKRLLNPPNAVEDIGIDLKRKPKPTPKPEPESVLEHRIAFCRVSIITDLISLEEPKPMKLLTIINFVAASFGITVPTIIGESRQKLAVTSRHVACYLGFKHTGMSMAAIGRRLDRDHTTIMHAIRKIKQRIADDTILALIVSEIESRLLSLPYDPKTHSPRPSVASEPQHDMEVWKPARIPKPQICSVDNSGRSAGESVSVSNDNREVQGQDHPEPAN